MPVTEAFRHSRPYQFDRSGLDRTRRVLGHPALSSSERCRRTSAASCRISAQSGADRASARTRRRTQARARQGTDRRRSTVGTPPARARARPAARPSRAGRHPSRTSRPRCAVAGFAFFGTGIHSSAAGRSISSSTQSAAFSRFSATHDARLHADWQARHTTAVSVRSPVTSSSWQSQVEFATRPRAQRTPPASARRESAVELPVRSLVDAANTGPGMTVAEGDEDPHEGPIGLSCEP